MDFHPITYRQLPADHCIGGEFWVRCSLDYGVILHGMRGGKALGKEHSPIAALICV